MTPYRQSRLIHHASILALLLGLLAMILMTGCKTQVKGGSSLGESKSLAITGGETRKDLGLAAIELKADGSVLIDYQRDQSASTQPSRQEGSEFTATTQPSVYSQGSATPRINSEDGGWSLSFDRIKPPPKAQWPLFLLFVLAGAACWKLGGNLPGALLCAGMALISVVWPTGLILLSVLAIALGLWSARKTILQLVQGNEKVLRETSPDLGDKLKTLWASKQDVSTQSVVKGVR